MAERNVTFNLKANVDPRAKSTVDKFSQDLAAAQERVNQATLPNNRDLKSHQDFAKERLRIERATKEAITLFNHQAAASGITDARQLDAARKLIVRDSDNRMRNLEKSYSAFYNREHGLRTQALQAEQRKQEQLARASLAKRLADYKAAKAAGDAAGPIGHLGLGSYGSRSSSMSGGASGSGGQQSLGTDKSAEAARQLREQFSEIGESVMKVTRGITMFGLVGEKDIGKVQNALLSAQGAFDIFGGSLKLVSKLEKIWSAYTVAIRSSTVALAAHNAITTLTPVGGIAGSQLTRVGGARAASSASTYGAIGAGVAAGSAPSWLSWAKSFMPRMGTLPTSRFVASGVGSALETTAGTGIRGAIAARVGTAGLGYGIPVAGQIAGTAMAAYGAGSFASKYTTQPIGRAIGRYSASMKKDADGLDKFDRGHAQTLSMEATRSEGIQSELNKQSAIESKINSMVEQTSAIRIAGLKGAFDLTKANAASEQKIQALEARMSRSRNESEKLTLKSQIDSLRAMQGQHAAQKAIADSAVQVLATSKSMEESSKKITELRMRAAKAGDAEPALRDSLIAKADQEAQKMIQSAERRKQLEDQIARTKADSAKAALSAAQAELDTTVNRIKTEQTALMSAQERFGMMSREDQTSAMKTLVKARTGASLNHDEINKLKSLGTQESERLAGANARKLAIGDYSQQSSAIKAIEARQAELRIRQEKLQYGTGTKRVGHNYDDTGFPHEMIYSKKSKEEQKQIQLEQSRLAQEKNRLQTTAFADADLRRSVFREEAGALSKSLNQRSALEAKISQNITVVANFENTAEQVAQATTKKLLESMSPYMQDVENRLQVVSKDLQGWITYRRKNAGGA